MQSEGKNSIINALHAAEERPRLRSWYSLLGFVQCACLLPKCPLKDYNVHMMSLLVAKMSLNYCFKAKWQDTWMLVTKAFPKKKAHTHLVLLSTSNWGNKAQLNNPEVKWMAASGRAYNQKRSAISWMYWRLRVYPHEVQPPSQFLWSLYWPQSIAGIPHTCITLFSLWAPDTCKGKNVAIPNPIQPDIQLP